MYLPQNKAVAEMAFASPVTEVAAHAQATALFQQIVMRSTRNLITAMADFMVTMLLVLRSMCR